MIQYRDGSFSEIMEYKQALEQFLETPPRSNKSVASWQ